MQGTPSASRDSSGMQTLSMLLLHLKPAFFQASFRRSHCHFPRSSVAHGFLSKDLLSKSCNTLAQPWHLLSPFWRSQATHGLPSPFSAGLPGQLFICEQSLCGSRSPSPRCFSPVQMTGKDWVSFSAFAQTNTESQQQTSTLGSSFPPS